MEHLGSVQIGAANWEIYKNNDGMIEGYKSSGTKMVNGEDVKQDLKRIVSNATTVQGFIDYVNGFKKSAIKVKPAPPPELPFT